jgi:hypothetical protein
MPGARRVTGASRGGVGGRFRRAGAVLATAVVMGSFPAGGGAQSSEEEVLVAAGQWALERLPRGAVRLDPHRTGQGAGEALARRLAGPLGAELATLEDTRSCSDPTDPSSCELAVDVLLALAAPRIDGDEAVVRVYAWHRSDDPRAPVTKESWDVRLQRSSGGWRVVSGG